MTWLWHLAIDLGTLGLILCWPALCYCWTMKGVCIGMSGANDGSGGDDCRAGDTGMLPLEKRGGGVRSLSLSKSINLL